MIVVDIFCGAGGFSEGFRQQGFEIILGIDKWKPAIETFNYNFDKEFHVKDILDYSNSIEEIENIPDSDIIIGSPPCVSFSSSNKSGKADKSLGLLLTECFFRIVAVKKYKQKSNLKAWFMENVVNSKKYLKNYYTFRDLSLSKWAENIGINPNEIAINLSDNSHIINSADYGSIQARKRLISGEIIKFGNFFIPKQTHKKVKDIGDLPNHRTIRSLKDNFPSPYESSSSILIKDPSYELFVKKENITDHFYDTGIYESEWENSKFLKTNHPYMGKMFFPENIDASSRTITATKIGSSREAIIYKSEINRKGNGEFRTPTVREAATIMGFPITYQFIGSENTKWRLVGNAVCPTVSRALAKTVQEVYNLPNKNKVPVIKNNFHKDFKTNLNNYKLKNFDKPPQKKQNSRFRRHPFKDGNMTVALSNYNTRESSTEVGKWRVTVFYGTGEGFGIKEFPENYFKKLEPIIQTTFQDGYNFLKKVNNGFIEKVGSKDLLQEMYYKQTSINKFLDPTSLIEEVSTIISEYAKPHEVFIQNKSKIFEKPVVPKKQLYALYIINKIISKANSK